MIKTSTFTHNNTNITFDSHIDKNDAVQIIWAHGWGRSKADFTPFISALKNSANHYAIDFPGFGESSPPLNAWGTEDYMEITAKWLLSLPPAKRIWVGHSFGCRVGIQLAAKYPELINSMCLIGPAGLPYKLNPLQKIYLKLRIYIFKALKKIFGPKPWLMNFFGSADYKNAGPLRKTFVKVVSENLLQTAAKITCHTTLITGEKDTETPPYIAQKYDKVIKNSKVIILNGQDHYTVLGNGRHPILMQIKNMVKNV